MHESDRPSTSSPLLLVDEGPARRPGFDAALLGLAEQMLRAGEAREVARALLEAVVTTYAFPRGAVLGLSEQRLTVLAAHGLADPPAGTGASAVVERALEQGAPQVLGAVTPGDEPWLTRLLPRGADLLVVPLAVDERRLGAVVLQLPVVWRGADGRELLDEVERAAHYAALALDRVQRLVQLQRLAATDPLTMIANRRSFVASLERELASASRRQEPVSLVMLDLDGFKQVNDTYGHPAGDEALRNVAAALTIACRDLDTAARYGGEEFVVILPDCDGDRSLAIAERLRAAVGSAPAVTPLTASAGVATYPTHARDLDQLVAAADTALLQAKRDGRDRTVVCQTPVGLEPPRSVRLLRPDGHPAHPEDGALPGDPAGGGRSA